MGKIGTQRWNNVQRAIKSLEKVGFCTVYEKPASPEMPAHVVAHNNDDASFSVLKAAGGVDDKVSAGAQILMNSGDLSASVDYSLWYEIARRAKSRGYECIRRDGFAQISLLRVPAP